MALTENDPTIPIGQPLDPYTWPPPLPPEWASAQQDIAPSIPLQDPGTFAPGQDAGRKGGEPIHHIGPALVPPADEVPLTVTAPPDLDAATDTSDPRGDMSAEELAKQAQATPPNPGEIPGFNPAASAQQAAADYSKLPEDKRDDVQIDQAADQMGAKTPAEREVVRQGFEAVKSQDQQREATNKLVQDDLQRQQDAFDSFHKSQLQAQKDLADIDTQSKQVAQMDTNHWAAHASTGQKILSVLGSITGGMAASSPYGNGRNVGLEMLQHTIDQDMEAQRTNINARVQQLASQRASVGERLNLATEAYKSEEIHRQALFQSTINQLQSEAQNYDKNGSTVARIGGYIQTVQQQKDSAMLAARKKIADLRLAEANAVKSEAEGAKTGFEALKLQQQLDGGNGTSSNYTVATGLFDPFTKQPILGKTKLKDEKGLQEELKSYRDEQRAWQQMLAISQRMDGHRGAGGQITDRFKSTDEKEYDRARNALLTVKIRALGERPTESAIKNQEALVPDLQKALGQADTVKMIQDAQQDNDAQFAGHLNILGVDGDTVIGNAKRHRATAPPLKLDDEVTAANEAVGQATTPAEKRDALAAVHAAQDRAAEDARQKQEAEAALKTAAALTPDPPHRIDTTRSPEDQAVMTSVNDAKDTYNQELAKYHAVVTAKNSTPDEVKAAALRAVKAKAALETIYKDADHQMNRMGRDHGQIDTSFHM